MNTPFKALTEIIRLTSPFPEGEAVKAWKARPGRIIVVAYLAVPEDERQAAREAMQFHGVPGGLRKELLYTDQASEDQDWTTFVRERWATNQGNIIEAMTAARRACFAPSPTAEKSLREGIYNDVKAARYQQNVQSGQFGNPTDAMADAIRVATFASGYGGNPQDTALAFPVPPELSKETEEVLREQGQSGRTATPAQVKAARAQVRAEKPPQIAAETAARTTAERIVSQTAGGVPERASATERKEYSEAARHPAAAPG